MLTQYYDIDMVPGGVPLTINVTQYDVGLLTMVFTPYASVGTLDLSALASAQIQATKPDGLAVVNTCTVANGVITYVLQDQIAMAAGRAWAKLVLLDESENVIASKGIVFVVDRAGVDDDASLSESDLSGVQSVIQASENFNAVLIAKDVSGNPITITDGAGGTPVDSLVLNLEPHQAGSGDPSPSNVRAITGWDAVNVTRTGKNLYKKLTVESSTSNGITFTYNSDGSITLNGTATARAYSVSSTGSGGRALGYLPAGNYVKNPITNNIGVIVQYIENASSWPILSQYTETSFTVTSDILPYIMIVRLSVASGATFDNYTFYPYIYSADETDLTWEEPTHTTLSITIPSSAGTVYGGTLDVTNGVLTVTWAAMAFNDFVTITYHSNGYFYGSPTTGGKAAGVTNVICDSLKTSSATSTSAQEDYSIRGRSSDGVLFWKDSDYTTVSDFQTAMGSAVVAYELATPLTYTLTAQELTTLLGTNVIWMDADGSIDLTYRGNPAINITEVQSNLASLLSLIAPTEDDYTATTSYAIGDFVIVDYTLYKVTAAIASGETITPGTNCTATTIAAQIQALA